MKVRGIGLRRLGELRRRWPVGTKGSRSVNEQAASGPQHGIGAPWRCGMILKVGESRHSNLPPPSPEHSRWDTPGTLCHHPLGRNCPGSGHTCSPRSRACTHTCCSRGTEVKQHPAGNTYSLGDRSQLWGPDETLRLISHLQPRILRPHLEIPTTPVCPQMQTPGLHATDYLEG